MVSPLYSYSLLLPSCFCTVASLHRSGRSLGITYQTQGSWISIKGLPMGTPVQLSVQVRAQRAQPLISKCTRRQAPGLQLCARAPAKQARLQQHTPLSKHKAQNGTHQQHTTHIPRASTMASTVSPPTCLLRSRRRLSTRVTMAVTTTTATRLTPVRSQNISNYTYTATSRPPVACACLSAAFLRGCS